VKFRYVNTYIRGLEWVWTYFPVNHD
jgi:hypothetical protein